MVSFFKRFYNSSKGKQRGFSLIEAAMVIVIISSLISAVYSLIPIASSYTKNNTTVANMDYIEKALLAFVNQYGYLPCPAPANAAPTSATTYGISADCSLATAPTGIYQINGNSANENIWVGVVPTRSLNIADSYMYDGYNRRINYAIVQKIGVLPTAATVSATGSCTTPGTGVTTGTGQAGYCSTFSGQILNIQDANGTSINRANTAANQNVVSYVLLSHGQNLSGSTSYDGASTVACPTTGTDRLNCQYLTTPSTNNVFIDAPFNGNTGSANYNDDVLRWKSLQILKNQSNYNITGGGSLGTKIYAARYFEIGTALPPTTGLAANAWFTRRLTTADTANNITGASLASNQVTLPAGYYFIRATAPWDKTAGGGTVVNVGLGIFNVTTNTTIAVGPIESSDNTALNKSTHVSVYVNFTTSTTISVRQMFSNTGIALGTLYASAGTGASGTGTGTNNTFTMIEIIKLQ